MSFVDMFKVNKKLNKEIDEHLSSYKCKDKTILVEAETKKPEEILRGNGYKIKLVTPTGFGTQIDFARKYDEEEITQLLSAFKIKVKGNSIFIVN